MERSTLSIAVHANKAALIAGGRSLLLSIAILLLLTGCMSLHNGTSKDSWSQTASTADQAEDLDHTAPGGLNFAP